jgi:O-antigen ligase
VAAAGEGLNWRGYSDWRSRANWSDCRGRALVATAIAAPAGLLPLLLKPLDLALGAAAIACIAVLAYAILAPRRWMILFFAASLLLPPFPIGGVSLHPSILVAVAGLLAGSVRLSAFKPRWTQPYGVVNGALAALCLALTLSLGFALLYSGFSIAAGSAIRVALFGVGVYMYFSASQGPDRQERLEALQTARAMFYISMLAALFACLDFVYQFPAPAAFGAQFLWLDSGVYRRAQGLFYEASTLGNFSAFFLVMSLVALTQPRARRVLHPAAASAGVVLFAAAMLMSFSRASLLAALAACLTLAVLERRRWAASRVLSVLAVLALIAVIAFAYALPEFASVYWQHIGPGLDTLLQSPDRVLSGRLEAWRTVAGFIANHPWQVVFGIGYKTLPNSEYLGRAVIADNMYLSTLAETGVPGLLALIGFNLAVLSVCWRAARAGTFFGKWMLCFWVGETIQMLSADILTYWRVLPLYFWVLAQAVRRTDLRAGSATGPIQ